MNTHSARRSVQILKFVRWRRKVSWFSLSPQRNWLSKMFICSLVLSHFVGLIVSFRALATAKVQTTQGVPEYQTFSSINDIVVFPFFHLCASIYFSKLKVKWKCQCWILESFYLLRLLVEHTWRNFFSCSKVTFVLLLSSLYGLMRPIGLGHLCPAVSRCQTVLGLNCHTTGNCSDQNNKMLH